MGSKRSLTRFGWCVGCFLVPACVYCPGSGVVGVGACFGLGIKRFSAAVCGGGKRAHCRVHVQHRVSVRCLLVVVARAASLGMLFLGCGLCVVGCL